MKTKLKIAQITPYYYPSIGGVSAVAQYISEELVQRGHRVDAITAFKDHKGRPPLKVPFNEVINGVNVFRYRSILNISHMSVMPGLITHLIKHKYDVLHYHSYRHPLCDISAAFGKIKKCVNVLHGHGPFFERGEIGKLKHLVYDIYDKAAKKTTLKWTDSIITLNKFEYDNFTDILTSNDKLVIIPNAADSISFEQTEPSDFIKKYNLMGKKIILCLGILNESKRQDLLIEALPEIIKEVPETFLVLVGPDGGLLKRIEEKAQQLNVRDYYTFIGPLMGLEKHKAFDSASLFTLVSDKDAYPLVIAEAMAHGLPIVATDARGPKDMVHNGVDGLIVKKRSVSEISAAIINLLKNDTLRKEMSISARRNAENNHSQTGVVDQMEKIYFDQLSKKLLQRV